MTAISYNLNVTCNSKTVGVYDGDSLHLLQRKLFRDKKYFTNHLHYSYLPQTKLIVFYHKRYSKHLEIYVLKHKCGLL